MNFLGIHKYNDPHRIGVPSPTYYNIPIDDCYVIFNAIGGDVISLIDISNLNNSVCVDNLLFSPVGVSRDMLPTNEKIVMDIVENIKIGFSGIRILEVNNYSLTYFISVLEIDDIVPAINRKLRENKINFLLIKKA